VLNELIGLHSTQWFNRHLDLFLAGRQSAVWPIRCVRLEVTHDSTRGLSTCYLTGDRMVDIMLT